MWEKEGIGLLAKQLANGIYQKLGKVPAYVESLAITHYLRDENARWIECVMKDFEEKDVSWLIRTFTGTKKLSIASACKLLAEISDTGEVNPAYVLQVYNLWDKAVGDQVELPRELLDRSVKAENSESAEEAKLAVHLFVAGVVVYLLMKLDELKYEAYYNYEEVESRSNRVDGRSEAYDRLNALITASSQKRSPIVPVRLKGKRNKESTKDILVHHELVAIGMQSERYWDKKEVLMIALEKVSMQGT